MNKAHLRKLQLGRKKAYLLRCIKVNNLLASHETDTTVRVRVFNKFIKPEVNVSYAQFNNMLNERNPEKQLEEIELELKKLK